MDIIVLDYLIKQTYKKQMSRQVAVKVYQEIELLEGLRAKGGNSLDTYLRKQNGKKMRGAEYVFKYRLTDGDRILYTYGKYLEYIREKDKDSLVIIAYAKHDDQGKIKLPSKQEYYLGKDVIRTFSDIGITAQDLADMSMEDMEAFEEILSAEFTKLHSMYVVSTKEYEDRDPASIDVYLSDEQDEYIDEYMKKKQPLLILGGAGTGKTIMATHILADYRLQNREAKCAYFTQSRELIDRIQKQYRYITFKNYNNIGLEGFDEVFSMDALEGNLLWAVIRCKDEDLCLALTIEEFIATYQLSTTLCTV